MTQTLIESHLSPDAAGRSGDTIAACFERQARTTPDSLAIVTDEVSHTYRELDVTADHIAAALGELGSARDAPIVLMIDDSPLLIASMLGAAKANRIFIPLESDAPEAWLSGIVAHSGTVHILADRPARPTADRIAGAHATVLELSDFDAIGLGPIAHSEADPDSPACVMYTSGSTGRPKGVVLTHRGVLHRSGVRAGRVQIGPRDRIAHLRAGGFVPGRTNVFATLFSGACAFPFEIKKHGLHRFASWLNNRQITGFTITSSLFRTWLASLPNDLKFPALRLIASISEPLYEADVVRAAKHLAGEWIIELGYGTTEVGRIAGNVIGPTTPIEQGILPVGHILPGCEVRLETEDGAVAGPGQLGEVVVKTGHLAQGYWNEPELTAATFPKDPVGGARLYRTGDLGRWRADGRLQHLGRKDRRSKLRGYTIEPSEVEGALLRLPGVRDATVVLIKDGSDDACLVGYVVGPAQIAAAAIRDQLAKKLPAYMVPAAIVMLQALPLTPSGKIDRSALPLPSKARRADSRPPANDIERALALIWQDVLHFPEVGVDDDFFELGGTSLQAFLIFAWIAKKLGHDLPPTTMVRAPTIARQADLLCRFADFGAPKLVPFRQTGRRKPLFIVHALFGDVMFVRELVPYLKSDRPLYALQPPPLDGNHRVHRTIEAIAADYLAEIRSLQPTGPYFFAGYSFGGWVAYEMAQKLIRQGETVGLLGMIDTLSHYRERETATPRIGRHIRALHKRTFREKLSYVRMRATKNLAYGFASARLAASRHLPSRIARRLFRPPPYDLRPDLYNAIYTNAARNYAPQPYAGPIAVFSGKGRSELHKQFWGRLARGGVTVMEIPAGHAEMVWPPYSVLLAESFDACLERAPH